MFSREKASRLPSQLFVPTPADDELKKKGVDVWPEVKSCWRHEQTRLPLLQARAIAYAALLFATPSSSLSTSSGRSNSAAARFSRKCATGDVPGMSRMFGARCNSQASATCIGVLPRRAATFDRIDDCNFRRNAGSGANPAIDTTPRKPLIDRHNCVFCESYFRDSQTSRLAHEKTLRRNPGFIGTSRSWNKFLDNASTV